jgi:hypothetical protein
MHSHNGKGMQLNAFRLHSQTCWQTSSSLRRPLEMCFKYGIVMFKENVGGNNIVVYSVHNWVAIGFCRYVGEDCSCDLQVIEPDV